MCDASRRLRGAVPALLLSVCLAACGGGGGGGGTGGGGGGGGGGGAPTGTVLSPQQGIAGVPGDMFTVSFEANDDVEAVARIVADADHNPATTGDQTDLFAGPDQDGATQTVPVPILLSLTPGRYKLLLIVVDMDNPPVVVEFPGDLLVYPAVAGVAPPRSNRYGVVGDTVVFSRGEAEDGGVILNGDGLPDDGVMMLIDAATGQPTQPTPSVSMDVTGVAGGLARPVFGQDGVLAWLTLEADEGVNLNGANGQAPFPPLGGPDVDVADVLVSYVRPAVSALPITNTWGGATAIVGLEQDRILVQYNEAGEGLGGYVLNGDGDAVDPFFAYLDTTVAAGPYEYNQIAFHTAIPGPAAGLGFRSDGLTYAAWLLTEAGGPLVLDPNIDGDQGDTYLAVGSLLLPGGAGTPANFWALAGLQVLPVQAPTAVDPAGGFDVTATGFAGYYIDEGAENQFPGFALGNDRSGDGVIGMAPAIYDTATATQTILGGGPVGPLGSAPGSPLLYDGTRVFFTCIEAPRVDPAPGTNGDGDGGADLQLLYWADHTVPGAPATPLGVNLGPAAPLQGLALDLGGSMTRLAPGWIALVVNELANAGLDINGSGAVDFAYLLLDTTTPLPTVYNPGLVPSTAGTFPLAGVWGEDPGTGAQGVVVRLTELANGNLDGDGNATETFLAFINLATPTAWTLLDAGGDHCAIANGMIAITADEFFTGRDYNRDGAVNGTVFRVLDFNGASVEEGRTCARASIPVTDTGSVWAYLRQEAAEGRDLNGDTDQADLVLGLWIP